MYIVFIIWMGVFKSFQLNYDLEVNKDACKNNIFINYKYDMNVQKTAKNAIGR